MIDVNRYIADGKVLRSKIARDIKYGVITKAELDALISDKLISSSFRGNEYNSKKPRSEWNKEYLEELSYAAIAESFNADYLNYLFEVATYVNNSKKPKTIKPVLWIALGILIVIAIIIIILTHNNSVVNNQESIESALVTIHAISQS